MQWSCYSNIRQGKKKSTKFNSSLFSKLSLFLSAPVELILTQTAEVRLGHDVSPKKQAKSRTHTHTAEEQEAMLYNCEWKTFTVRMSFHKPISQFLGYHSI